MGKKRRSKILWSLALIALFATVPAGAATVRPANDDFAQAEVVPALPFAADVDALLATFEPGESFCTGGYITEPHDKKSVWYRYTPSHSENIVASVTAFNGGTAAIFTGSTLADLTLVHCFTPGWLEAFDLQGGTTYFLQVTMDAIDERPDFELNIDRTGRIHGQLVDAEDGHPLTGCSVQIHLIWDSPRWSFFERAAETADDSKFTFEGLPPGAYEGTARCEDGSHRAVYIGNDVPQIDVFADVATNTSIPMQRNATISGKVTDESGQPLVGICVLIGSPYGYTVSFGRTKGDGTYEVGTEQPADVRVRFVDCVDHKYISEWYDDVTQAQDAMSFTLEPGVHIAGIDAALERLLPPLNDDIEDAMKIQQLPFGHFQNVYQATRNSGETIDPEWGLSNTCTEGGNVWYRFAPQTDQWVSIWDGDDEYGNSYGVWEALTSPVTSVSDLKLQLCGNGYEPRPNGVSVFHALAGHVYYVEAGRGFGGYDGEEDAGVSVRREEVPPNDAFSAATSVSSLPFDADVRTHVATADAQEPKCAGMTKTVWYRFTPSRDMRVLAETTDVDFNATIALYEYRSRTGGLPVASREQLVCDDIGEPDSGDYSVGHSIEVALKADSTYFFQIGGAQGTYGSARFVLRELTRPLNDGYRNAEVITSLPSVVEAMNSGATTDGDAPQTCGMERTIWYRWTAPEDTLLSIDTTGGEVRAVLAVYRATGLDTGVKPADLLASDCNTYDSYNGSGTAHAAVSVARGETILMQAGSPEEYEHGLVRLELRRESVPSNDDVAAAMTLPAGDLSMTLSTYFATTEPGEQLGCEGGTIGKTVWFSFTPTEDMTLFLSTMDSNYDTYIAMFEEPGIHLGPTATRCETGYWTDKATLYEDLKAGTTYLFQIGGERNDGGRLKLSIQTNG